MRQHIPNSTLVMLRRIASAMPRSTIALFLLVAPALAKLPVKTVHLTKHTSDYDIDFAYPQTGVHAIDADVATYIKTLQKEFIDEGTDARQPGDRKYDGGFSFNVVRNDDTMFEISGTYYYDLGGAHPNSESVSLNYLLPDGARVYLPEIVGLKGIRKISDLTVAQLNLAIGGPDGLSDPDWVKRGAGPNTGNFAAFALLPDKLKIWFSPYQVAAYAAGPQGTTIPVSAFKQFIKPNWRAPQPSFDCDEAKSKIEKALCTDAGLARAERKVVELYAGSLLYVEDDAHAAKLKDAQRAWLKARDAACGAKQAKAAVACLAPIYNERIKALTDGT